MVVVVVEDEDKAEVRFLIVLDFLLLLCQPNLDFDFGWDDNGAADSSEDPDSDPCSAFLFPVFD